MLVTKWTNNEIEILKKEYPKNGSEIPILKKNHSIVSIQKKAQYLNIKGRKKRKYDIQKKELHHLYIDNKMSTVDIAEYYDCAPLIIRRRMHEYNIPFRSRREGVCIARNFLKHIELNDYLNQVINGLILSDGYIQSTGKYQNTARIILNQSIKNQEWTDQIKNIFEKNGIKSTIYKQIQIGGFSYPIPRESYNLITSYYVELKSKREQWYPKGKKIVPKDIKLTPIVLAHWFMGDGSCCIARKGKNGQIYYKLNFWTDSFEKEDVFFLKDLLNETYGYNFRCMVRHENAFYLENSRGNEIKVFLSKTSPYMINCFKYKWDALYLKKRI